MNISMQNLNQTLAFGMGGGLKSTQDKNERQQKCASQVSFFENQKENLKNMQCDSLDDIARKLEMLHSYEDMIAAAKKEYNNSQMTRVLDEAKEIGEKIAEAAEKMEPKTEEERKKELAEEAMGTEEKEGMLTEMLDEMTEAIEEMTEELEEEMQEELVETAEEMTEELKAKLQAEAQRQEEPAEADRIVLNEEEMLKRYQRIDFRV